MVISQYINKFPDFEGQRSVQRALASLEATNTVNELTQENVSLKEICSSKFDS